ncbi:MAG TPA: type 1 glutamine amidotransferase domain-containing protein [Cytophagaceae bacterium]|jgi:protease I
MEQKLKGKNIAVLVDNGFEQVEMTDPIKALKEAGATVSIVSKESKVKGWNHTEWGDEFTTDVLLNSAKATDFHGLLLPGGVMNPDKLRNNKDAVAFVTEFMSSKKPVAAICHGPWTLLETGMVKGRKMTSYESIKTDMINAGVNWVDQEVVVDQGLVTSRKPSDIPAFNEKMIEEFAEGVHSGAKSNKDQQTHSPSVKNEHELRENIDDRNFQEQNELRTPAGENL